jgi:hypothetical protein
VQVITGARRAHSDDLDARVQRYLISMAVRTACVILAVVVDGWLRWVFVAGAVGLPYLAVVMANARGDRHADADLGPIPLPPSRGLPAPSRPPED